MNEQRPGQGFSVPIVKWSPRKPSERVTAFMARPAFDPAAENAARAVLADVKARGDAAVLEAVEKFDGVKIAAHRLRVSAADLLGARREADHEFRTAAAESYKRVLRFATAGLRKNWSTSTPRGGMVGEQFVPFDRVGVYIPGGSAPLVSTVLMTVTLAKVAGVPDIVACTPPGPEGRTNPNLLLALELAGATEIYRIGGIQAIGAMAFGTETVRRVQKIVGPGGPYVTAAKRLVYGDVALDLVAGPSEIAILADETAVPEHVAADLLAQAEHGTGFEKALLVTPSEKLVLEVQEQLARQAESLSRKDKVARVLQEGTLLVAVNTLDEGIELCNEFAPEHLEIIVREPKNWLRRVRCAGAVMVGPWSPVAVGDFLAGPSHVLPTGGAARSFSGLTVDDFRRRQSLISFTRADLKDAVPFIRAFGRVEGLDAHARSADIRFEGE